MADTQQPSLYDQLDTTQVKDLTAIRYSLRAFSNGRLSSECGSDPQSGNRTLGILDSWLLDEEQKQDLRANSWDIFFLYSAGCLLGLENGNQSDNKSELYRPAQEKNINNLNAFFESDRSSIGITDNGQAAILRQIINGYLARDPRAADRTPHESYRNGIRIHVQFLSACLRLATAFDLKAPVTLSRIGGRLSSTAPVEPAEIDQFFAVNSSGPHPHMQATALVRLDCTDADVHRALKNYESRLQRLLSELNRIVRPRFLFTSVRFEITPHGYEPIDFKFSVDTSAALQLFMGNTLYKDRRVFLRELVQNAVDACNLRKMRESDYAPSISVAFSPDISKITVRDNGIGMSRQWLEKYFLNIGLSFYQSDEIIRVNRDANIQFSFISQFGIGFLSSFLVARKVTVKSRKAGAAGISITITDIEDYFEVRLLEEKLPIGTEVKVYLKENKFQLSRSLEYLGYLKTNVRFLPIPVSFEDENGEKFVLGQESMDYAEEIKWGTKFTAKLDFRTSRGYLLLRVIENHQYIYDLESSKGGVSIFQDGIFITQLDTLLPENARNYVVGRINLVGDEKCELSMDRNHLFWPKDQLNRMKKRVLYGLVDMVNNLLTTSAQQAPPENVRQNLVQNLATFFDFNEIDDLVYDRLNPAVRIMIEDKFRLFIRVNHRQFGLLRNPDSEAANSHGYIYAWQQAVIDGFKSKVDTRQ